MVETGGVVHGVKANQMVSEVCGGGEVADAPTEGTAVGEGGRGVEVRHLELAGHAASQPSDG